jgi:hypothetical protein
MEIYDMNTGDSCIHNSMADITYEKITFDNIYHILNEIQLQITHPKKSLVSIIEDTTNLLIVQDRTPRDQILLRSNIYWKHATPLTWIYANDTDEDPVCLFQIGVSEHHTDLQLYFEYSGDYVWENEFIYSTENNKTLFEKNNSVRRAYLSSKVSSHRARENDPYHMREFLVYTVALTKSTAVIKRWMYEEQDIQYLETPETTKYLVVELSRINLNANVSEDNSCNAITAYFDHQKSKFKELDVESFSSITFTPYKINASKLTETLETFLHSQHARLGNQSIVGHLDELVLMKILNQILTVTSLDVQITMEEFLLALQKVMNTRHADDDFASKFNALKIPSYKVNAKLKPKIQLKTNIFMQ